jgi:peptidoglycan/xylan/chitin deacetylase (PgdA/CDA1 family)
VFVVSDHVGATNNWSGHGSLQVPTLPLMRWTEIEKLAAAGVQFGSHTKTHPDLRFASDAELTEEIMTAADTIRARLGAPATSFSFPYGGFNERAVSAVARVHSIACTTELRPLSSADDALRLPRLDAYYFRRHGVFERYGSSVFRRYIWLRASGRRLRQALKAKAKA